MQIQQLTQHSYPHSSQSTLSQTQQYVVHRNNTRFPFVFYLFQMNFKPEVNTLELKAMADILVIKANTQGLVVDKLVANQHLGYRDQRVQNQDQALEEDLSMVMKNHPYFQDRPSLHLGHPYLGRCRLISLLRLALLFYLLILQLFFFVRHFLDRLDFHVVVIDRL